MRSLAFLATLAALWWPHVGVFDAAATASMGGAVTPISWALDPRPLVGAR